FYGHHDQAQGFTQRAVQAAKNAGALERAAAWEANAALYEAEVGNKAQARALTDATLAIHGGREAEIQAAVASARAGQVSEAEKRAADLDAAFPRSTMVQTYWLPTIRAAIELQKNNPNRAIELLGLTAPYELGNSAPAGHMYPSYLRGEAYLLLGRGQDAA